MKVRDLTKGDTFHMVGGNRKYKYLDDLLPECNDTRVLCTHIYVPYLIDLDEEVENINEIQ